MIYSFADRKTADFFAERRSRSLPPSIQRVALRKLAQLHAVTKLEQLGVPPGNRLEALKGRQVGFHSIRINDQWRIRFRWEGEGAHEVEIIDYH
jgi:proteic killer suppression protein